MTKEEYQAIIERVEHVRKALSMNKTRFSAALGMKPQTYSNFVGQQGSKPNVELICGVIREFRVNPHWLLFGLGEPFAEGAPLLSHNPVKHTISLEHRMEAMERVIVHFFAPNWTEAAQKAGVSPQVAADMEQRHRPNA